MTAIKLSLKRISIPLVLAPLGLARSINKKQIRIILIDKTRLKLQGPPTRYNILEANSLD